MQIIDLYTLLHRTVNSSVNSNLLVNDLVLDFDSRLIKLENGAGGGSVSDKLQDGSDPLPDTPYVVYNGKLIANEDIPQELVDKTKHVEVDIVGTIELTSNTPGDVNNVSRNGDTYAWFKCQDRISNLVLTIASYDHNPVTVSFPDFEVTDCDTPLTLEYKADNEEQWFELEIINDIQGNNLEVWCRNGANMNATDFPDISRRAYITKAEWDVTFKEIEDSEIFIQQKDYINDNEVSNPLDYPSAVLLAMSEDGTYKKYSTNSYVVSKPYASTRTKEIIAGFELGNQTGPISLHRRSSDQPYGWNLDTNEDFLLNCLDIVTPSYPFSITTNARGWVKLSGGDSSGIIGGLGKYIRDVLLPSNRLFIGITIDTFGMTALPVKEEQGSVQVDDNITFNYDYRVGEENDLFGMIGNKESNDVWLYASTGTYSCLNFGVFPLDNSMTNENHMFDSIFAGNNFLKTQLTLDKFKTLTDQFRFAVVKINGQAFHVPFTMLLNGLNIATKNDGNYYDITQMFTYTLNGTEITPAESNMSMFISYGTTGKSIVHVFGRWTQEGSDKLVITSKSGYGPNETLQNLVDAGSINLVAETDDDEGSIIIDGSLYNNPYIDFHYPRTEALSGDGKIITAWGEMASFNKSNTSLDEISAGYINSVQWPVNLITTLKLGKSYTDVDLTPFTGNTYLFSNYDDIQVIDVKYLTFAGNAVGDMYLFYEGLGKVNKVVMPDIAKNFVATKLVAFTGIAEKTPGAEKDYAAIDMSNVTFPDNYNLQNFIIGSSSGSAGRTFVPVILRIPNGFANMTFTNTSSSFTNVPTGATNILYYTTTADRNIFRSKFPNTLTWSSTSDAWPF